MTSEFISVGTIEKPHGFRGSFVVRTSADRESALSYLNQVYLSSEESPLKVEEAAWMPKGWKLTLSGLTSDAQVKTLIGRPLLAKRSELHELPHGEFYVSDLEGCTAVDAETGEELGTFVGLEDAKPYAQWWFRRGEKEFSIPSLKRFISAVDLPEKKIRLTNFALPEDW